MPRRRSVRGHLSSATAPAAAAPARPTRWSYQELVFPTLKPSTQIMRRNILARFCREFGGDLVVNFEHKHIAAIVAARAATPHAGNNLRKVLRHLFKHAVRLGWRKDNPVSETDRLKTTGDGIHTWTDAEIEQYRDYWPLGTQQRLCFEIALETTLRRSDVTKLGPQHIRGDKIATRHSKNATANLITISAELRAAIEACPTKH
jgi:site-specific recombinase XerD